jgi:RNA polymerase primary sigma factor
VKKNPPQTPACKTRSDRTLGEGRIILTPDELLDIFPEPENCISEIESAIEQGLVIVREKAKKDPPFVVPEVSESEITHESIAWYLNQIGRIPLLTAREEKEFGRLARSGDKNAREKMINANLRLVVSQAKKFKNRGVYYLDLIQAGNLGLIKAVSKFDPEKSLRFGIFAITFIKDAIWKTVRKHGYLIKMPRDQAEKIKNVQMARLELIQQYGRGPSVLEVATKAGLSEDEVENILKLDASLISLDNEIGNAGKRLMDQVQADDYDLQKVPDVQEEVNLDEMLQRLTEPEKKVIKLLYGLKDQTPLTPAEAAARLDLSLEEVMKIEDKALEKMKESLDEDL